MFHLLLVVIYLSFISLGLPDGLLGAAWPTMYPQMQVPVSWSGIVFIIISVGTVVSSLLSDRLTRKFGTGKVTAISVAMTAAAMLGFSVSRSFWMLCLWAIPYGLGAGSVDSSLNGYVALHYESRHMSWLHCMWGIGATTGPYIMGAVLTGGKPWAMGYQIVGIIQAVLTVFLFASLSLWKRSTEQTEELKQEPLHLGKLLGLPGVKEVIITFFCYCALEQTAGLWASSYLVLNRGFREEAAASFAGLYYLGITLGRFVSGFITMKIKDAQMVWLGITVTAVGILLILLPLGSIAVLVGLAVAGLGSAPIFPCIIHATPEHFGANRAQALVGIQMASAYVGTCLMPPLFGILAEHIGISLFPIYLMAVTALMAAMFAGLRRKTVVQS